MLVATAGHIDHGKTALIRALTGVDTDRLPEERQRRISIDLGFAHWSIGDGATIAFVDVPGHERFVRNMLAGVCSVDLALLVVAADDGVMPQTIEHVQILNLLGIDRGIVAITKCDRASRERIDAVRIEVGALLAPTPLAPAPLFEVSPTTGAGMTALAGALRDAGHCGGSRAACGDQFRLAIDRAFSVTGVGTVVTGTVIAGHVAVGERLILSPRGAEIRVRGLQSGGRATSSIGTGERCALNLTGIELAHVHRGDWLLPPSMHAPTSQIEARVRILPDYNRPLPHNTPVHFHLCTADVAGRMLAPTHATMRPGSDALVHLALEHSICALTGDRFILRDQSGRHLLGGGQVVDPFFRRDRRSRAIRAAIAAALESGGAEKSLAALLAIPGHELDTLQFERSFNLGSECAAALYSKSGAVLMGETRKLALSESRVEAITREITEGLAAFHRDRPEAGGMSLRDLRSSLSAEISAEALLSLQKLMIEKRQLESVGSLIKLPGHSARSNPTELARWQRLLPKLQTRGAQPFTVTELARELGTGTAVVKALLHSRRANGDVWHVIGERFMLRQQVAALAARAAALQHELGGNGFTAAQYRDATGIGRNFIIQLLEFFDGIGVTRRTDNIRRVRPDYELVVGKSAPYGRPPSLDRPS